MSTIKIGALVDGRYRISARIGHGGMAEVYEANDIINKRKVAIKLIREDVMINPINLRRFQNLSSHRQPVLQHRSGRQPL